jgi:hypothetical protein
MYNIVCVMYYIIVYVYYVCVCSYTLYTAQEFDDSMATGFTNVDLSKRMSKEDLRKTIDDVRTASTATALHLPLLPPRCTADIIRLS